MQFLEKPYFTNAYINRVIRNYSLDKLNVYLSQKRKEESLKMIIQKMKMMIIKYSMQVFWRLLKTIQEL